MEEQGGLCGSYPSAQITFSIGWMGQNLKSVMQLLSSVQMSHLAVTSMTSTSCLCVGPSWILWLILCLLWCTQASTPALSVLAQQYSPARCVLQYSQLMVASLLCLDPLGQDGSAFRYVMDAHMCCIDLKGDATLCLEGG